MGKRRGWFGVLLLWGALTSGWAASGYTNWWVGRVVAVPDGDTLRVLDGTGLTVSVRLAGVDAPELRQCGGPPSRDALADRVLGLDVVIEPLKTDRYGRTVARVHRGRQELGLYLVAAGHAWHYTAYAHEQTATERQAHAQAQARAVDHRAGLWSCTAPQPPWDFRRAQRAATPQRPTTP